MSDRIRAALQRLTELEGHTLVDCTADWAEAMIEARAALAEPVGEPAPPAAGEVREVADGLRDRAAQLRASGFSVTAGEIERAADLLERQAALAEPVGEGLTDEELLATLDKATADFPPRHPEAEALNAVEYPLALELRKARAVLARFGHQPAPPAAGEVGELVRWLRGANWDGKRQSLATRAADLLEQRHPAPVPVAERLQQLEDLAADAVSGLRYIEQTHGRLYGVGWDRVYEKADRLQPGHALPLPAGEVQP